MKYINLYCFSVLLFHKVVLLIIETIYIQNTNNVTLYNNINCNNTLGTYHIFAFILYCD